MVHIKGHLFDEIAVLKREVAEGMPRRRIIHTLDKILDYYRGPTNIKEPDEVLESVIRDNVLRT